MPDESSSFVASKSRATDTTQYNSRSEVKKQQKSRREISQQSQRKQLRLLPNARGCCRCRVSRGCSYLSLSGSYLVRHSFFLIPLFHFLDTSLIIDNILPFLLFLLISFCITIILFLNFFFLFRVSFVLICSSYMLTNKEREVVVSYVAILHS